MTNALAYNEDLQITTVKSFITLSPGLIFTALHFLRKLLNGPKIYSVNITLGWLGCPGACTIKLFTAVIVAVS